MATTYSVASGSWTYRLYVTETATDIINNTSTITCEMRIYRANGQYSYIENGRYALKVTINGVTQTSGTVTVNKSTSQAEVSVTTLTFTVPHNDDGTGVASITYCQFISSGGTSPSTAVLGDMPKNFGLTTIPRASDITCNSPVVMATNQSVKVTQKSTSFSHKLYYSTDDGNTYTLIGSGTATKTYSWTVPDIAATIPNADSATYILKCETFTNSNYEGDPLESTLSITATVPASYVPSITIGTISEGNSAVPSGFPFLVGISTLNVPTTFAGSANSTVVSRNVNANGETQSSTSSSASVTFNLTKALSALSTVVTANTTDSRGRTGSATKTVTAQAYSAPSVEIDCTRCQSDGTIDALGEYVLVRAKWNWTSVKPSNTELNSASIKVSVDGTLKTTYTTTANAQTDFTQIVILPNMSASSQFTITVEIADRILSASVQQLVTKAVLPFSLFDDGNGVGATIGRMANAEGFHNYLDEHGYYDRKYVFHDEQGNTTEHEVANALYVTSESGEVSGTSISFTTSAPTVAETATTEFTPLQDLNGQDYASPTNVCPITGASSFEIDTNGTASTYDFTNGSSGTVYSGTLDLMTGVLTVNKKSIILNGSSFKVDGVYGNGNFYTSLISGAYDDVSGSRQREVLIMADRLRAVSYQQVQSLSIDKCIAQNTGRRIIIRNTDYATVATMNAWLSSNNVQIVYELATPETYQLTPAQLSLIQGLNSITATNSVTIGYGALGLERADGGQVSVTATNAVNDGNGNNIADTYATKTEVENAQWETIWTGTLKGRNTISLDMSEYSMLRVFAISWGTTVIFDLDLTKTVPNTASGASGYPYVGCGTGGVVSSSNQWEEHHVECCVNTAKSTFYNLNQGYSLGTTYNVRNNYADYYVYRIDGYK